MSTGKVQRGPIPVYAWIFAVLCFAIPVIAVGGAIPSALGVGGGMYCLSVARETQRPTRRRILHCAAASVSCWILFLGFAGGVLALQNRIPGLAPGDRTRVQSAAQPGAASGLEGLRSEPEADPLGEETLRREIYKRATRLRKPLADARARHSDRRSRGLDPTVAERQIAHLEKMQEDSLDFTARFHKITRAQLDAIIAEGDRLGWPSD